MIELLHNYYCDITRYSYNLVKKIPGKTTRTVRKDGTEIIKDATEVISYHGSLSGVINAAMREMQRERLKAYNEDISLRSALNEIEAIYDVFEKLLKETISNYEKLEGGEGGA